MKPTLPRRQTALAEAIRPGHTGEADWYKDAVIYQLHVRGFADSNADGVGDFAGLTSRLDHIQSLGVSALWLLPFYPSPLRDDGYDISHYQGVHPAYGNRRDFRQFLDAAHDRGLRVITELVINHTSDQHVWFQAARRARPGSAKRNFYVWSNTEEKYEEARVIFTDTERSNWTWDAVAEAYYWHRFFHHQPDLNFDNPVVRKAMVRVMRFWLDMGVDGMRLDAVPYLIERDGTSCENLQETHAVLREIRAELDARYSHRVLLAEANQWPSDVRAYFGDGDECHMAFHFPLMPRLFMALQQEDRHPISEILAQTPDIPASCQWAIFLRNHDELTLEMVTDEERDYMYQAYAMDPRMRINVGIRRRLAPLMENSRPRIELLNGLLLSLPGTPIIYYGDEIGMGDNIYLGDRNGVRTPMQWSADQNAGFSRADPARLYAPVIMDSVYGYQAVNVEAQERSPHSLLNWMRRAITLRQQHRTFGRGTMEMLRPDNRRILAFIRRYEKDDPVLVVANLSRTVQPVALDLASFDGLVPVEMSGQSEMPRIGQAPYFLTLGPYALYWFILRADRAASPARVADTQPAGDQSPILLGVDWSHMVAGSTRGLIERRHLVPFLRRQRWFTRRAADLAHARVVDWATLEGSAEPTFLALIAAGFADGAEDRYVVPFTLVDGPEADAVAHETPNAVITRIAGARKGVVHGRLDAAAALALVDLIERAGELPLARGRARGLRTQAFDRARGADGTSLTATPTSVEQSNSSIRLGDRLILKVVRRLLPGVSPELELGRFLTEHARPGLVPPLAGAIEYDDPDRGVSTLALLHGNVPHQSDGWQHALGATERFFDIALTRDPALGALPPRLNPWSAEIPELARDTVGGYLETATVLGRRTAELHLALGSPAARAELGAGVLDDAQIARLAGDVRADAGRLVEDLEDLPPETRGAALDSARVVLAHPDLLRQAADIAAAGVPRGLQTMRIHGDYHLGQVLHHEEAFTIVDFEGEPTRSIEERRRLNSPMKDVAGMVRSFSYAVAAGLEPRLTVTPRDAERLAIWSRWWRTWTTASFLQAYRAAAGDAAFLPSDADAAERLLRFFLLEKILYEVKYEAAHRPDWIIIPLEALAGLVAALAGGDDPDAAASAAGLT